MWRQQQQQEAPPPPQSPASVRTSSTMGTKMKMTMMEEDMKEEEKVPVLVEDTLTVWSVTAQHKPTASTSWAGSVC